MKRTLYAAALLSVAICSQSALCQSMQAEGNFASQGLELKTIVLDLDEGMMAATTSVTSGACSGTISGLGKIKGKLLILKPYAPSPGTEACTLHVEFDDKWKSVKITEEGRGCAAYHGAACAWEGQKAIRKK